MALLTLPNYTEHQPVHSTKYLEVFVDKENQWLYTNWIGTPSAQAIKDGMEVILDAMKQHGITKILNDNRQMKGTWTAIIDWAINDWTPRALKAGYRATGMIYSPDVFGKFSVDSFLKQNKDSVLQQMPFHSFKEAVEWLRAQ